MFRIFYMHPIYHANPPLNSQPLYYAYESVTVNELGDLNYACSEGDLAPSGARYGSIANQVCAVQGAVPGQAFVSGAAYVREHFDFHVSHMWRNVGINVAIFVFFALCTG